MARKTRIAAVIDIGSNELNLQIAQSHPTRGIKYLESLSYPLGLGRDTFQSGKMSFEKADKACEIIKNFLKVIQAYDVKRIRTVATTAVREATNMDYILDQIKIKTGLTVQVIDDREEKLYLYKLLMHQTGDDLKKSAMMVYIGAGNIGVSLLSDGRMPFLANIKVGFLRIDELFGDLEDYTRDFYQLMEEYLASYTDMFSGEITSEIKHFIVSGHEIETIAALTGALGSSASGLTDKLVGPVESGGATQSGGAIQSAGAIQPAGPVQPVFEISREKFLALYDDIKRKTTDQIAVDYGIDSDRADVLLPAACIYQNLLGFTSAKEIMASQMLPCDAVLFEMLYPKVFSAFNKQFDKNTLLSAKLIARRFHAREEHYKLVYSFALTLFDKMKKIHGLGSRDKLLLQAAAILHDTGKHINNRNHYRHSYEIVRGSDIVGLNHPETEMVALLCLYHSRVTPSLRDPHYAVLDVSTRVRVSKLTALLRLADALDRSHMQKFSKISVKSTADALTVLVVTDENISLEQWSFTDKGRFFEEVYGIKAAIRVKRILK